MRKAHIMGIEGVGMSALARLLMAEGVAVTGCDLAPGPRARRLGVPVHHGHDPGHLADEDTLVVPTPVPPDHPEVVEARKRGLRVLRRMELLAHFLAQRPSAGVTGTHGKTTTTGMLAAILLEAGLDPWVFLGGARPPPRQRPPRPGAPGGRGGRVGPPLPGGPGERRRGHQPGGGPRGPPGGAGPQLPRKPGALKEAMRGFLAGAKTVVVPAMDPGLLALTEGLPRRLFGPGGRSGRRRWT